MPQRHVRIARLTRWPIVLLLNLLAGLGFLVVCVPAATLARYWPKRFDVGIGPEPLINNVYHKQALLLAGYTVETFVDHVYFITSEFDYRGDVKMARYLGFLRAYVLMLRALCRYRVLYIYFNGGPLQHRRLLWRLEPLLFRLAGTKVVVMAYGGDVQDMTRSQNLLLKHGIAEDYPEFRRQRDRISKRIDLWTRNADHVISGVEWVDYMYHWDTLMLGHFAIDTERWKPEFTRRRPGVLRVLHAPNHRAIKGTEHVIRAVEELHADGVEIELVMLEGVPNHHIKQAIADADVVVDQLIIGWYAMFALEAMALGKPVVCNLREDLVQLYTCVGLVGEGEIPLVNATTTTIKDVLRTLASDESLRGSLGERGRRYVQEHHSLAYIGGVFGGINRRLGVEPSGAAAPGRAVQLSPEQAVVRRSDRESA